MSEELLTAGQLRICVDRHKELAVEHLAQIEDLENRCSKAINERRKAEERMARLQAQLELAQARVKVMRQDIKDCLDHIGDWGAPFPTLSEDYEALHG